MIWAAYSKKHITRENAEKCYGNAYLKTLLDNGMLIEEDGIIKGTSENAGTTGLIVHEQLGEILRFCQRAADGGRKKSGVSLQTKSVTREFKERFNRELQEFLAKFYDEAEKKENIGDNHVFFGVMFNSFLDLENDENDEREKEDNDSREKEEETLQ